jgi:hypothetical protein
MLNPANAAARFFCVANLREHRFTRMSQLITSRSLFGCTYQTFCSNKINGLNRRIDFVIRMMLCKPDEAGRRPNPEGGLARCEGVRSKSGISSRLMICEEAAIGCAMLRTENLHEIQFLLEHFSVQTTERYLVCKQRVQNVVNDSLEIEPRGLCATRFLVEGWPTGN